MGEEQGALALEDRMFGEDMKDGALAVARLAPQHDGGLVNGVGVAVNPIEHSAHPVPLLWTIPLIAIQGVLMSEEGEAGLLQSLEP